MSESPAPVWYTFFPLKQIASALRDTDRDVSRSSSSAMPALARRTAARDALGMLITQMIGRRTPCPPISALPSGKPRFEGAWGAIYPSVSYAEGWGGAAISLVDVGFDVDSRRLANGWAARANYVAGCKLIADHDNQLAAWVRIEACIKHFGGATSSDLSRLRMTTNPVDGWHAARLEGQSRSAHVRNVPAPQGCHAAIATQRKTCLIQVNIENAHA